MKSMMQWLLLGVALLSAQAAAGGPHLEALDPTFGEWGDGRQTVGFPGEDAGAFAITTDSQNRILVGGYVGDGVLESGVVVRLLADGRPDPTFARIPAPLPADVDQVYWRALAAAPDGGVVAAGTYVTNNDYWFVCRLDAYGHYLGSFGSAQTPGCTTILPHGLLPGSAYAIGFQANGKILVAGRLDSPEHATLMRLTQHGALDPTFGDTGIAHLPEQYGTEPSSFDALAIASDDSIAVAGAHGPSSNRHMLVARLTADGQPLEAFGGGIQTIQFTHMPEGQRETEASDVHLADDGTLLLTGYTVTGKNGVPSLRPALAMRDAAGNAVEAFGMPNLPPGQRIIDTCEVPPCEFYLTSSEIESDGRILLTGLVRYSDLDIGKTYAMRLSPLGDIDPSFASNDGAFAPGVATVWWPASHGFADSTLQGNKLALAGTALENDVEVFAAIRFRDGTLFSDDFETD